MTKTTTTTTATSNTAGLPWVGVKASTNLADGCALSLVLLRDLVRWLMRSKEIAFMGAARELHGALQGLAGLRLYVTGESGAARVVGAADTFDLLPVQRRIYSHGIGLGQRAAPAPASLPDGVTPGMSAALHYVGNGWGGGACLESILDDDSNPASRLAMPCDQAAAIFGRIAETTPAETSETRFNLSPEFLALRESRKDSKGEVWTDPQKNLVWAEICKYPNRTSGLREYIAQQLGLESAEAVSKLVRGKKRPLKLVEVTRVRDGKKVS